MLKRNKRIFILSSIIALIVFGTIIFLYLYDIYYEESTFYDKTLKVGLYDNEPKVFEDEEGMFGTITGRKNLYNGRCCLY